MNIGNNGKSTASNKELNFLKKLWKNKIVV